MGWKTSCILATKRGTAGLLSNLEHDIELADRVAALIPGENQFVGLSNFDKGMYPGRGQLYVGAYPECLLISHSDTVDSCFEGDVPQIVEQLDSMLKGCTVLALQLHSVVGLYGYAVFEHCKARRIRAGSADDGIYIDVGDPLPEEVPLFAAATTNQDGELIWLEHFEGSVEELDHSGMGEDFVFAVSLPFFGTAFDRLDHAAIPMSEYKFRQYSMWQRLWKR